MPLSCLKPKFFGYIGRKSSTSQWETIFKHLISFQDSLSREDVSNIADFFIDPKKLCFGGAFNLCRLTKCLPIRLEYDFGFKRNRFEKLMVRICYSFQYLSLRIVLVAFKIQYANRYSVMEFIQFWWLHFQKNSGWQLRVNQDTCILHLMRSSTENDRTFESFLQMAFVFLHLRQKLDDFLRIIRKYFGT